MRSRILYSIRACKRSVSEVENGVEWAENRVEPDGRAEQSVVLNQPTARSNLLFHSTDFITQGYGPGLDVSVSRRTNVSCRSCLEKNLQRLGLVSVSGGRHLGLGHLRFVPKTNFRPNCAGHSTQCERALDIVSLCCSYYCSSY